MEKRKPGHHFFDDKIDTGAMILSSEIDIVQMKMQDTYTTV
jgi:hypothetical protein